MASNLTFFPVTSDAYWEIELTKIQIGGIDLQVCETLNHINGKCGVAIDTGTSLLAGPTNYINQILRILKLRDDCSNYNEMPDIIIDLSGTEYILKP